jgi:anti-sigma regulatory factor (Ser/Thr protein kinase)
VETPATLELVPTLRAPRLARAFVADTLAAWAVDAEDGEAAQLVVSELVTNAVVHAPESQTITLELSMTNDALRVVVSDRNPDEPDRLHPDLGLAESGRGVRLVEALSKRWGTKPDGPDGKTVWCELSAHPVTTKR